MRRRAILVAALGVAAIGVSAFHWAPKNYSTKQLVEAAPFPARDTAQTFVFNDKVWLSNGYVTLDAPALRDLWSTSNFVDWELVNGATPYSPRATMAVLNGTIYAVGHEVWTSTDGKSWQKISDNGPSEQSAKIAIATLRAFRGRLWYFEDNRISVSDNGIDWEQISENPPYGDRVTYAVLPCSGSLVLLGGGLRQDNPNADVSYPRVVARNDVWASDDGVNWRQITDDAPWSKRMWPGVACDEGRLVLFGGFSNIEKRNLGELWTSSDLGETWHKQDVDEAPTNRHWPSMIGFHGKVLLAAGNAWPVQNDVWVIKRDSITSQLTEWVKLLISGHPQSSDSPST